MDRNKRIPLEDYSFSDGLKSEEFDPNRLSSEEQESFGKSLGLVFDLVSTKEKDRTYLRAYPYSKKQINFFQDRLIEGTDFAYKERRDGRFSLSLYNPFIVYSYENELPAIGPTLEDNILKGVLTNASLRTVARDGRKIIHVSKNQLTTKEIANFADLKKLNYSPLEYSIILKRQSYDCYSLWFYDPAEVAGYQRSAHNARTQANSATWLNICDLNTEKGNCNIYI